jgi:transcriptional regulator with XRE-family HTH domain
MNTRELLDAAKAAQGWKSDYRLCKALGVTSSRLGNWRSGRNTPDDGMVLRLAQLAGIDPARVLAGIAAERSSDAEVKRAWLKIATAAAVLLAVQFALFTDTGSALIQDGIARAGNDNGLYIMRTSAAWLALVACLLLCLWSLEKHFPEDRPCEFP